MPADGWLCGVAGVGIGQEPFHRLCATPCHIARGWGGGRSEGSCLGGQAGVFCVTSGPKIPAGQPRGSATASDACSSPLSHPLSPVCSSQSPCRPPVPPSASPGDTWSCRRGDGGAGPSQRVSRHTWRGNPGTFLLLGCGSVPTGKGLPAVRALITFKSFYQTLMAGGLSW